MSTDFEHSYSLSRRIPSKRKQQTTNESEISSHKNDQLKSEVENKNSQVKSNPTSNLQDRINTESTNMTDHSGAEIGDQSKLRKTGRPVKGAVFSAKLSCEEMSSVLKIKSKCGLCGIFISDKLVDRHMRNKHNIKIKKSYKISYQPSSSETIKKDELEKIKKEEKHGGLDKRKDKKTDDNEEVGCSEVEPADKNRILCMLKLDNKHKMCGKCGQVYLKLRSHRRFCTAV